jgi:hypothetical protein
MYPLLEINSSVIGVLLDKLDERIGFVLGGVLVRDGDDEVV